MVLLLRFQPDTRHVLCLIPQYMAGRIDLSFPAFKLVWKELDLIYVFLSRSPLEPEVVFVEKMYYLFLGTIDFSLWGEMLA
jgi:hypothetical protein